MSSNRRKKDIKRVANSESFTSKTSDTNNANGGSGETDDHNMEDRLDRELAWCTEQLKLGIRNKPSNDKQVAEAMKILRILQSSSTPLPKKRQVMRATFGDYRKKMEDELKQIDSKSKNNVKKIRVNPVPSSVQCKSTFYKKSASSGVTSARLPPTDVPTPSDSLSMGVMNCSLFQREPSEGVSSFSFGFSNAPGDDDDRMAQAASSEHVEVEQNATTLTAPSVCSFSTTGSMFRFDFEAD